jgi:hypothetical protein
MDSLEQIEKDIHACSGIKRSYISLECPVCKKVRTVRKDTRRKTDICIHCILPHTGKEMEKNPCWKGGRVVHKGYMYIKLPKSSEFYLMAGVKGYIAEHRLVMAQFIGRCLNKKEEVHHINSNKLDNRIENLAITNRTNHPKSYKEGYSEGFKAGYAEAIRKIESGYNNM